MLQDFRKNVAHLIFGTSVSSLIGIVIIPILSRLYSPADFGMAGIFVSVTSILGVIACLRYEQAILLPEDDEEAVSIFGLSALMAALVSVALIPLIYVLSPAITKLPDWKNFGLLIWLIPVAVFFHGIMLALTHWNMRRKSFGNIAVSKVGNQAAYGAVTIGGGVAGYATGGMMIIATIIGKIVVSMTLLVRSLKDLIKISTRKNLNCGTMKSALTRYKDFPLYGSWSILLGVGAWQLPVLLMGVFFSASVVGFYVMGFKILQMPMNLVGSSIGQVFFQSATLAQKEGTLPKLTETLFEKLVILSLFPMLMLTVSAKDIYTVVFGENWATAGTYTQILGPWALVWFLSAPFTSLFSVLEKQGLQLQWNILNFLSRLGVIVYCGLFMSPLAAVWGLGIIGFILYGAKIVISYVIAGADVTKSLNVMMYYTLIFLPFGMIVLLLNKMIQNPWVTTSTAVAFTGAYMLYMVYKHKDMFRDLLKRQKKKVPVTE